MAADATTPTSDDRARAYRARLKEDARPSVIVDCATAEVLAANAGGLNALGLTPANRLPAALDSAMPGIAALRELTANGFSGTANKTLMFWQNGRAASWLCSISAADASTPTHLVIVFCSGSGEPEDQPSFQRADNGPISLEAIAANDDAPPRVVRNDEDTLKEIARRIREGPCPRLRATEPAEKTEDDGGASPSFAGDSAHHSSEAFAHGLPVPSSPDVAPDPPPAMPPPDASAASPGALAANLPPSQIAKLAHELKTPLTAIAAAAEIMRDERLGAMGNAKYLDYAADIYASATHALAVIGEMLSASTGDEGPARIAFDLSELATTTVSSLQPLAAERWLTLSLDAEPGLTPIRANPTAIRQILINLLTNALKFTASGGEVRVVTGYLNDGAVYMVVRDTGTGMDHETLLQVMSDAPAPITVRAGGGRGIGLKLVRRLAAENGAEFEIDSAPGMGTIALIAFARDLAVPAEPVREPHLF